MNYGWILLGMCVGLFFLGNAFLPITDPVESNYVLTAREMLASGDWMSPRIYGHYWYDKPIMFYWELIVAFALFGINEFAARFFPSLVATFSVFLTYRFAGRIYSPKVGFVSSVILATSVEFWYLSHAVITDMTLFAAISAVLIFFYLGYSEQKYRLYYVAYAAAGVAVLTKGPIGLLLPGLIILLFLMWERDLKHLAKMRLLSGFALFCLVISLWYYPMYRLHGDSFIDVFFGVHNYLRATVSEHPSQDVIYYYLLIFVGGFIPWVFAAVNHLIKKIRRDGMPELDRRQRFLFVWAFTVPVVFQCFATKYLTYTLPYMMPVAILFALYYVDCDKLFRRLMIGSTVAFTVLVFAVALPVCNDNSEKDVAKIIDAHVENDAYVISFGRRYPASLVFYLNRTVWRLEKEYDITRLSPHSMSWSSTNVMPFIAPQDLKAGRQIIALVGKKSTGDFMRLLPGGGWHLIGETRTSVIYERKAGKHE